MATSFAGFYLALWFVLWSFILRGVSIEVGGHITDRLWQSWWDFVFAVSSVLLAVLFGAALGNVIRGVPLDESGKFSMSLFTDFGVRGRVGILDWYTVSVAVFATVLLSAHGATYLRLKTIGQVHERSERLARALWTAAAVLFAVGLAGNLGRATGTIRGDDRAASAPGLRSRSSWQEPGRSSLGCAEQGRVVPLRDRARSSPVSWPALRPACFP